MQKVEDGETHHARVPGRRLGAVRDFPRSDRCRCRCRPFRGRDHEPLRIHRGESHARPDRRDPDHPRPRDGADRRRAGHLARTAADRRRRERAVAVERARSETERVLGIQRVGSRSQAARRRRSTKRSAPARRPRGVPRRGRGRKRAPPERATDRRSTSATRASSRRGPPRQVDARRVNWIIQRAAVGPLVAEHAKASAARSSTLDPGEFRGLR
jgi:hypothetical protein